MTLEDETGCVPHSTGIQPPSMVVPDGATDCHHHIFDPRFPKLTGKPMRAVAVVDDYRKLKARLGLSRSVVVAPASYGYDNACLLDALDQLGATARGVAIAPPDVADATLSEWHERGVRGLRVYLEKLAPPGDDALLALSRRLADRGWHIEIMPSRADKIIERELVLGRLACPIVIDHLGYIPQPRGEYHTAVQVLERLLSQGQCWIKLSGVYFTSKTGFPTYHDVDALAQRFVRFAPDRMLWGTDWPHSGETTKPDDALLMDQLARWITQPAEIHKVLVTNPNKLYWA